jgi:type IV pilus assembly protein PilQ
MKSHPTMAALLALALAPAAARGANAELNVVKAVQVQAQGAGARVVISGTRAPTFTVFRLSDPARVIVDLAGADVSAVRGPRDGAGPVSGVAVSQFSDERAALGRVVVAMAESARYDVRAASNDVVVAIQGGAAEAGHGAAAPAEDSKDTKDEGARGKEKDAGALQAAAAPEKAPASPKVLGAQGEKDVVASRRDEKVAQHPGHRLTGASVARRGAGAVVALSADGEVGTFEEVELEKPPRLALDLYGFEKGLRPQKAPPGTLLKELRFGKHEDKVRVVLEALGDKMPAYAVARTAAGLEVSLTPSGAGKPVASAQKPESTAVPAAKVEMLEPAVPRPVAPQAKPERRARLVSVRDVTFRGDEQQGRVMVIVPRGTDYRVTRPDPHTAVLTLSGASIPKRLERSLDTSAFGGPVKMVSSFAAPGQPDVVQIVATLDRDAADHAGFDASGQLSWEFSDKARGAAAAEMTLDGRKFTIQEESAEAAPRTGGFSAEAPGYAASAAPRKARYVGRRVSFEFKDIDIHNLLRIISEVSKKNVIVADNVSGKVTIRLRNVPWDQALELILKSKGLDKEEMGNILRIAPAKELEEERRLAAERAKSAHALEPLKVRLIPVNYATAGDVSAKVKDLLSDRGSMSVDARTNVIIVKDTADALARAEGLVRRLDTQTPQVLIEGRIVEANTNFSRDFGIQWGGNVNLSPTSGNPTGLTFPNVVRVAGGSTADSNGGTADAPNFAVNLPAAVGTGAGGALGFVFGSAGGAVALNLRLSAMESHGQIKTISAPKITTLDNNPATIAQGVSIPYSQTSGFGASTTFMEAKLELKVTPHVTADGSVLLQISATNNQPNAGVTGASGQPSISKKEAQTQVLVKDGDTTVIGGIYTRSTSLAEASVPVLSKIPVLGWLFKKQSENDSRTELLIFITPRIVNRSQVVAAGEGSP